MANSQYAGPSAGYHAPPDPAAGPRGPYDYPPQSQQYNDFDPNTGQPLPQGYVPPRVPPASSYDPQHFPPPPRSDFDYQNDPPPAGADHDRGAYDARAPSDAGTRHGGYAASDVRPTEGNALAPWNEEKADAEWQRGYDEDRRRYQRAPPPASAYDPRYDDRYEDERYDDRAPSKYDTRPPHTAVSPDSYYDYRDRKRNDRAKDSRRSPPQRKRDILRSNESDSGLGAQLLGGAAGAYAGHEFGGGILETIGGAFIGAVGAKVIEKQMEKRKSRRGDDDRRDLPPASSYDRADSRGRYPSTSVASRAPARDSWRSRSRSVRGARSRSRPRASRSRSWSGGRSTPPRR